ncbi:hypothetical protein E2K59_21740, partial [Escherichia coli]
MAVNELIKLTKIENNVDLNKFTTICTDVLSPRVTRHNKEKKQNRALPFCWHEKTSAVAPRVSTHRGH